MGLVLARVRVSERESEMKESGVSRTVGAEFFLFLLFVFLLVCFVFLIQKRQMPARVEKNLWLCASVRGRNQYECVHHGHHKDIYCISRSLRSLSLIVFYQP